MRSRQQTIALGTSGLIHLLGLAAALHLGQRWLLPHVFVEQGEVELGSWQASPPTPGDLAQDDYHFHPLEPFTVRSSVTLKY